ncbi:hypothetical protein [Streptoalloteichus hindustanus]|uniref:Abortive infection protein n=1 Tax=Streptoalloteichus hindustanus TaxID=2017 RepID=A0A1M5IBJ6_STRHI|nr:hypothetical protein [Streptoalloteichus hindustanus]SHG25439.1 hypothetical protein SAMN05444320_107202 [Streptoalloteichus hindustanus]
MRGKGISYDTGFLNGVTTTHEPFDPDVVQREMRVIRDDLHCDVVRVTGGDPERLEIAARHAADLGMAVWFSPFTYQLTPEEMLELLADCADRAERLRQRGAEIVLVTGAELSLFNRGFLPGDTSEERIDVLLKRHPRLPELMAELPARINEFLGRAVRVVRERFGGKVSYASIPFEGVDWTPFDVVSVDLYRTSEVADQFVEGVRSLVAQGKPVAITEFGCCTYRGASARGARGGEIVEWDGPHPVRLTGDYARDEAEQAAHLRELLDIFTEEGVDTAFVYTFANYHLPHRDDPREDLDLASYGVVRVFEDRRGVAYPDMAWEPKAAFGVVADYYRD